MKVYIAGPYTKGDVAVNVARAIEAADMLLDAGHVPFCPHLTHFWHLHQSQPYQVWLDYDMEWLRVCDVVLRLDGESSGADKEVAEAEWLGKTVYYGDAGISTLFRLRGY